MRNEIIIEVDDTFIDNRPAKYNRKKKCMITRKGSCVTKAWLFCRRIEQTKKGKKTKRFLHAIKCRGMDDLANKINDFIESNNAVVTH
ncbi:MAG: hypothetical protein FVQ79_00525 [Planctomycetes bacterium]|nr:hypothetical protein [Planctomycetota bacterium]